MYLQKGKIDRKSYIKQNYHSDSKNKYNEEWKKNNIQQ